MNGNEYFRLFYSKLIFYSAFPVLITLLSLIFWLIFKIFARLSYYPFGRAISVMVIIMFLVYPTIVSLAFSTLRCVDVDGDLRLLDDLEIQCWSSSHTVLSLYVAIPSLVVWGLGMPFVWLLYFQRYRKEIDIISMREKWGFLFSGYKKSFFFWEIIITYRKVLIIFISVYLTTFGVIT